MWLTYVVLCYTYADLAALKSTKTSCLCLHPGQDLFRGVLLHLHVYIMHEDRGGWNPLELWTLVHCHRYWVLVSVLVRQVNTSPTQNSHIVNPHISTVYNGC